MPFSTWAITNRGGRQINEDSSGHLQLGKACCWVVADGLGGHGAGEVASRLVVDAILRSSRANPAVSQETVRRHLESANRAVCRAQGENPQNSGMRSTAVVLLSDGRHACWGHAGDTRLYHVRSGCIQAQTKDDSVPQAMVASGALQPEQIRFHEDRNRLLRSLGEEDCKLTISRPIRLSEGDSFLLCSDGFWEYVSEVEMQIDLVKSASPQGWLEHMETRLQQRAASDNDNYSAIAVQFRTGTAACANARERALVMAIAGLLLVAGVLLVAGAFWSGRVASGLRFIGLRRTMAASQRVGTDAELRQRLQAAQAHEEILLGAGTFHLDPQFAKNPLKITGADENVTCVVLDGRTDPRARITRARIVTQGAPDCSDTKGTNKENQP